ncbi:MAG: radical SAM/SPASM domain-containing protein [Candidatus Hodarchaeota archaeon]
MKLQKYKMNLKYAFRPHKPIMMLRLALTYFKILFLKKNPLRYVDFNITSACNLSCQHCFATVFKNNNRRKMKIEDYRRVIKQANKLGAVNFSFQGGEPLLYPQLEQLIKAAAPYKNVISVTTNGTPLSLERAKKLKKIGVDIFTISLDSMNAEEHDSFRNKQGTFDKTLKGIDAALEAGCNVTIGTVLSHQNIRTEGIERLFEWVCQRHLTLCLALAVPAGEWANNSEILLTEEDMAYLGTLQKKYSYVRTDFEANYLKWGCGAIKEILYITPYGDVLPCPYIHISFGNIFDKSLEEIRNIGLGNKYFKEYWQKCLCATDREFIDKFISKINDSEVIPINYNKKEHNLIF